MQLATLLHRAGLSEKEATVYLASLELGAQPASVIAKRAELNRVTTYQTFRKLVDKGLASSLTRSGIIYFSVEAPDALLQFVTKKQMRLEQVRQRLSEHLDTLTTSTSGRVDLPVVRHYEGIDGVCAIYNDIARYDSLMYIISPTEHLPEAIREYWRTTFFPRINKNKGSFEMVSSARRELLQQVGVYNVPTGRVHHVDHLDQRVEVVLYNSCKVAFLNYTHNVHGVLLEDKFIYDALKFQFQVMKLFYQGKVQPVAA
jgi:sugar-specific transcriptional regulator TrmB